MAKVAGFDGNLIFDGLKPDGTIIKLMDIMRLKKLGWQDSVSFEDGFTKTYSSFENHFEDARSVQRK